MSEEKNSTCGYCRDAVGQVRPAFIARRAPFGGIRACSPLGGPEQDGTEFAFVFPRVRTDGCGKNVGLFFKFRYILGIIQFDGTNMLILSDVLCNI